MSDEKNGNPDAKKGEMNLESLLRQPAARIEDFGFTDRVLRNLPPPEASAATLPWYARLDLGGIEFVSIALGGTYFLSKFSNAPKLILESVLSSTGLLVGLALYAVYSFIYDPALDAV